MSKDVREGILARAKALLTKIPYGIKVGLIWVSFLLPVEVAYGVHDLRGFSPTQWTNLIGLTGVMLMISYWIVHVFEEEKRGEMQ